MSNRPMSRGALTPVGNGNNVRPPPSDAVRIVRRGLTPRSASKSRGANAGTSYLIKPKLTVKQQLEIMRRLETGNFKADEGLAQFYEQVGASEAPVSGAVAKMTCKQNLFSSFASVDPIACSTRNYGNSVLGSMESLISAGGSSVLSGTGIENITCIEAPNPATRKNFVEDETDAILPEYLKTFHKLMSAKDAYKKSLIKLAENYCDTQLASLLPEAKMVSFFKSLERVHQVLQKFLQGNATENMKLFMPFPKSKEPVPSVHCDIEVQQRFINALHRLDEIVNLMDSLIKQDDTDFKVEAKIEHYKDLAVKLESLIKTEEEFSHQLSDVVQKSKMLALGDDAVTTFNSSRGMRTQDEEEVTPSHL